jgi:bifunctional DNA-binding transcriptional regulator/antitoxin component of YhaV-PrlF toxin-antitoxin module
MFNSVTAMQESRVGSKGELFPPKEMRDQLGLKACTKVLYKVEAGRLIVEPVPTVEDLMKQEPLVEMTLEEFHKDRKELSKRAET